MHCLIFVQMALLSTPAGIIPRQHPSMHHPARSEKQGKGTACDAVTHLHTCLIERKIIANGLAYVHGLLNGKEWYGTKSVFLSDAIFLLSLSKK
jgi:hypothetical protein